MAPRDTYRYTIRDGNRIVKYGVTNDPERRFGEILRNGINGDMRIEGPRVTRNSALDWERGRIDGYQQRNGKLPPGNKV